MGGWTNVEHASNGHAAGQLYKLHTNKLMKVQQQRGFTPRNSSHHFLPLDSSRRVSCNEFEDLEPQAEESDLEDLFTPNTFTTYLYLLLHYSDACSRRCPLQPLLLFYPFACILQPLFDSTQNRRHPQNQRNIYICLQHVSINCQSCCQCYCGFEWQEGKWPCMRGRIQRRWNRVLLSSRHESTKSTVYSTAFFLATNSHSHDPFTSTNPAVFTHIILFPALGSPPLERSKLHITAPTSTSLPAYHHLTYHSNNPSNLQELALSPIFSNFTIGWPYLFEHQQLWHFLPMCHCYSD